jgi:hypothetical protein
MSFETTFSKSIKGITQEFKATAQQMISNGCNFSCQCLNISATNGEETIYPESIDVSEWMKNFIQNETKTKPLNPKALEEMAKKGVKPKKGISEIILVAIVPSVDKIHVGILIPESFHTITSVSDFVSHALVEYEYNTEYKDNYAFIDIAHRDSLKERDVVLRVFFTELKRLKIYVEDEEDDELVNYLEE